MSPFDTLGLIAMQLLYGLSGVLVVLFVISSVRLWSTRPGTSRDRGADGRSFADVEPDASVVDD